MASNVPYSKQNELLNSSSEDLDNEEDADIALRTKKFKKKGRIPRPIEPNVQVQNDQDYAGKSEEVSEDKDLGYGDIWSANKVKRFRHNISYMRACDLKVTDNRHFLHGCSNAFVFVFFITNVQRLVSYLVSHVHTVQ